MHAAIEVDEFIVLTFKPTRSNVHDSREVSNVWDRLTSNVTPKRSLADAMQHGATPYHGVKKRSVFVPRPRTLYRNLVSFARHWPRYFMTLYAKRARGDGVLGHLGAARESSEMSSRNGRKNEVRV